MEQVDGGTSSRRRGIDAAASANKQAADSRALALASTIRELMAAGFVSRQALADELNRRRIPAAYGGSWHRTSVCRVMTRLELAGVTVPALKRPADVRAAFLGQTILRLRKAGFSVQAIARELNERKVPTPLGAKWHSTSVGRLLHRLERLEASSRTGVTVPAFKRPADVRAAALGQTIHRLRKAGFSVQAIARELNERKVPTPHGAKWHSTSVGRLLHRLERLAPSSRTAVDPEE
jgi:DNA-binding transcriptional MerR regulator